MKFLCLAFLTIFMQLVFCSKSKKELTIIDAVRVSHRGLILTTKYHQTDSQKVEKECILLHFNGDYRVAWNKDKNGKKNPVVLLETDIIWKRIKKSNKEGYTISSIEVTHFKTSKDVILHIQPFDITDLFEYKIAN